MLITGSDCRFFRWECIQCVNVERLSNGFRVFRSSCGTEGFGMRSMIDDRIVTSPDLHFEFVDVSDHFIPPIHLRCFAA